MLYRAHVRIARLCISVSLFMLPTNWPSCRYFSAYVGVVLGNYLLLRCGLRTVLSPGTGGNSTHSKYSRFRIS